MRPVVLIGVDWFLPAYKAGGPIRSVANLVGLLAERFEVRVLTGAYDLGSSRDPLPVALNTWVDFAPGVQVKYVTADVTDPWPAALAEWRPAYLYLNSVYSKPFSLDALRAARRFPDTQVVLAPRGMLGAGALSIKPLKKRLFLAAARMFGWFRGVRWHASTDLERQEVQHWFPGAEVVVAGNLPTPSPAENPERPTDRWVIICTGRVNRKKNIAFGICALQHVDLAKPVEVRVFGPPEDEEYLQEILSLSEPDRGIEVKHFGSRNHEELSNEYLQSHFLLLSTLHENFGHSIAEAWAHGCPVLIADTTPWRGLEEKGIGWDWALEEAVWQQGLAKALAMSPEEWRGMSENARAFFADTVLSPEVLEANRRIFRP